MTSKTISTNERKQLQQWITQKCDMKYVKLNLLFKATRDGCNSKTFHDNCNNKGPTVTLVFNNTNFVFGGYTSQPWTSAGNYVIDPKSFLFRLQSAGTFMPTKYDVKPGANSIYNLASYGPTFGGGHDMLLFSGEIKSNGSYYTGNGGYSASSFNYNGESFQQINGNSMLFYDIEVYQFLDSSDSIGETPWRANRGWDAKLHSSLMSEISHFTPSEDLNISHFRILLVGQVGAGKSSFINTVNSTFKGRVVGNALTGTAAHSLTTKYRVYPTRDHKKRILNFKLCDTMGLEEDHGLDLSEYLYIMDGNIQDQFVFNPVAKTSPRTDGFKCNPSPNERIHCVTFIIDCSTFSLMPNSVLQKLASIREHAIARELPNIVVLTKIDKISEYVAEDLTVVYESKSVGEVVQEVSDKLGVSKTHIFVAKNYESETDTDENIDILALTAIKQMLLYTEDSMQDYLDKMDADHVSNISRLNIRTEEK